MPFKHLRTLSQKVRDNPSLLGQTPCHTTHTTIKREVT